MNNSMSELIEILKKLIEEDINILDKKKDYVEKFEKIYTENFRHMYSELLTFMLELDRKGKTDILISSIREIYDYTNKKEGVSDTLQKGLKKLYDHLNMDFKRLSYMNSIVDRNVELDNRVQNLSNTFKEEVTDLKKEKEGLEDNISLLERKIVDAIEVKKDLVSIMGIFLGIFLFFQLNFSQIKDLLEYDPFSRVIYLIIFNIIFLVGLYLIFVIIDFLIHSEPRLLKLFIDVEKKLPNKLGYICITLYIIILCVCGSLLYSDTSRKTISKIENKIEKVELEQEYLNTNLDKNKIFNKKLEDKINTKQKEIETLKKSIEKLEEEIKKLNQE